MTPPCSMLFTKPDGELIKARLVAWGAFGRLHDRRDALTRRLETHHCVEQQQQQTHA